MHLNYKEAELAYFSATEQLELAIKRFDQARETLDMARHGIITPQGQNEDCSVECDEYSKALQELGIAITLEQKCETEWQMQISPLKN
jgi:hypothetical protein